MLHNWTSLAIISPTTRKRPKPLFLSLKLLSTGSSSSIFLPLQISKLFVLMGRITHLRDLIGIIKDKASQSKAAIVSKPKNLSLNLALLRATTHDPFTPPHPKHITIFLSYGYSSRVTASAAVEALMDRLQSTHDSSVAIKCLAVIHHIIKDGSFILQDQLSVYPSTGGRNYLKLSSFRDNTTPMTWELSSWVRWYDLLLY